MDPDDLQAAARAWRHANFPPATRTLVHQVLGVAEETGELSHAVLKMEQGIRGDEEKHMLDAQDAIGDIVIYLTGVCDCLGVGLKDCVIDAWDRVEKRDWVNHPTDGGDHG